MPQTSKTKKRNYQYTVGRRKTATARVRYYQTADQPVGTIMINGKKHDELFQPTHAAIVVSPIELIAQPLDGFFTVKVEGGGVHAQAEAVRHGIARMLVKLNEEWKGALKAKGYMTRDPRQKERKKPGLKRARRAPQWSKR